MARLEHGQRLLDDMILVGIEVLHPAFFDKFHDPARIEIDAKTDAAAELAQVLNGQTQTPGAGGPEHQPIGAFGEVFVRKSLAEYFIVRAEILDIDTGLRYPGRAAGFKNIDWPIRKCYRHPAAYRTAPEPFILKQPKFLQV